jgi:tRNA pseudouridine13 synthase
MLPFLTSDFPGIGGVIRQRDEDFFVQEIPLYEASGDGEHILCEIQKVGLTTFRVCDEIGRALNVHPRDIGFAGMKDAHAVARQLFTIPRVTEEAVMQLAVRGLTPLWAAKHRNKLKLGHLKGNRFAIKIRDVQATDVVKLRPVLDRIEQHGLPNYFGEQRFGRRNDNDALGAALLRNDSKGLLDLLLGKPSDVYDKPHQQQPRRFYDKGELDRAMKAWPRSSGMERRVLHRLSKTGSHAKAAQLIDPKLRRLWNSAVQSRLFNDVVAARIQALGKLLPGDLAYLHGNGACFKVEDVAAEQPRADAWEISPTGPLLGFRMTMPAADALALEQTIYDKYQLKADDFRRESRDKAKGARRPIRVRPTETTLAGGVDEHGPHITVAFTLPSGSFATSLLRELMKNEGAESLQLPSRDARPTEDAMAAEATVLAE